MSQEWGWELAGLGEHRRRFPPHLLMALVELLPLQCVLLLHLLPEELVLLLQVPLLHAPHHRLAGCQAKPQHHDHLQNPPARPLAPLPKNPPSSSSSSQPSAPLLRLWILLMHSQSMEVIFFLCS